MRRILAGVLVLVLLITPLLSAISAPVQVFAQEANSATTTDNLNLRATASLSGPVLLMIPRGASVVVRGAESNGFLPVTYQGTEGWAHSDYLAVAKPEGVQGQTGTVTEALNLRVGPSTSQRAILVLPAGATVTVTGVSSNGFLAVTYGGYTGYAHSDWISTATTPPPVTPAPTAVPSQPISSTGKVTESLNLRVGATTESAVILVMPAGADVTLTGSASGDFLQLRYKDTTGWAHKSWISLSSSTSPTVPAPVPPAPLPPVTTVSGIGRVTEALNLRSEATTAARILLVMPAGARVTLAGDVSGLFYKVTYNGQTGWAHKDWIELVEAEVLPANTAYVTEAVVLRSGPAVEYQRLLVLPAGARVTLIGQQSNGFHSVSYNGKNGWAFSTYLQLDQAGQNLPVVPPGSVEAQPDLYPPVTTNMGFHYTNTIVGAARGTPGQAIDYAKRASSLRIADVELYIYEMYRLAPTLGFDPSLLIAQSALETDYWRSTWWNERLNPAGLGISDDLSTHPYSGTFPNGTIAARAQLAHMHAEVYGMRAALPAELQGVDITYESVIQAGWAGTVVTLEDLAGTWATDPLYGWKISRVAAYIFG